MKTVWIVYNISASVTSAFSIMDGKVRCFSSWTSEEKSDTDEDDSPLLDSGGGDWRTDKLGDWRTDKVSGWCDLPQQSSNNYCIVQMLEKFVKSFANVWIQLGKCFG